MFKKWNFIEVDFFKHALFRIHLGPYFYKDNFVNHWLFNHTNIYRGLTIVFFSMSFKEYKFGIEESWYDGPIWDYWFGFFSIHTY